MPHFLMDSESDDEPDEPSTSSMWDDNSPIGTPSVSSVFSYSNYIPLSSHTNSNYIMVPDCIPPNPFSTSPTRSESNLKDPGQCMMLVMPVNEDNTDSQACNSKKDTTEYAKRACSNEPLTRVRNPKQPSSDPRVSLRSDTRKETFKEPINNEEKEMPKEIMHEIKEKAKNEERKNHMPFLQITKIDEIYDLPKGPVDLKNIESFRRSCDTLKYSKNLKHPRLAGPRSKMNKLAGKVLLRQILQVESSKTGKREKLLSKFQTKTSLDALETKGTISPRERLLSKSLSSTPSDTFKICAKSVEREKQLVKSGTKTPLSIERKSLKTEKKKKQSVKSSIESSLGPVEIMSPETPKKEKSSIKSSIKTIVDTSKTENKKTAASEKLPRKSLIKRSTDSSDKRTSRSGKKEKSLRFADEVEVAVTPRTNEWMLQRSRTKAKYLFSPTLRIKQQGRSLLSRSCRVDNNVSGPQNDSKLIISVDKVVSSSNKNRDTEGEEIKLPGCMIRRRKGRKRKRLFSMIKRRRSESKDNTRNESNNNFDNDDSIDGNYEKETEMNENENEESEYDTSLDQMEESSFELEKEDTQIPEDDDSPNSKVTFPLEFDDLQDSLKKNPDIEPRPMSLAEKIKFDILKGMQNKSKIAAVDPVQESSTTSDPVPKETSTESRDNEQTKDAPSKISNSPFEDKLEDSGKNESENRLELTELSAFENIQEMLLEIDKEELFHSTEKAKNSGRKRKQEVVFRNFEGIIGEKEKKPNQTLNETSCSNCKKVQKVLGELDRLINLKILESSQLKCPLCYKLFISIGYTRLHMEIDHFVCKNNIKCNTRNSNNYSLKAKKTENFKCNLCSKIFNSVNAVQLHMRKSHIEGKDDEINFDTLNRIKMKSDHSLTLPDSVNTNAFNGYQKLDKNTVTRTCSDCKEKYEETNASTAEHSYANKDSILYRCTDCAEKHVAETTNLEDEGIDMSDSMTGSKLEEEACTSKLDDNEENDTKQDQQIKIKPDIKESSELDVSEFIIFKPKKPVTLTEEIKMDKIKLKETVEKKKNNVEEDSIMAVHQQYSCMHCKKRYGSQKSYVEHMYFFHDVTLKDFVVDDLLQPSTVKVNQELSGDASLPKTCSDCFLEFINAEALIIHRFTVHDEQSMVHICENCGKILTSISSVNDHQCQNVKHFECEPCKKTFTNSTKLKSHNDMYHFEKEQANTCSSCDKFFLTNRMLRKHFRMNHLHIEDKACNESMMFHVIAIDNRLSAIKQRQILTSSLINTLEYERINKVVVENYESNGCKIIPKRHPNKSKYCILCDQFITTPTLVNHWIQDHADIGEICNLCGGLYQKFKEVVHLLRHHIDPSIKNTLISVDTPFTKDVDTLIRHLGIRRLLSIVLYSMIEKQFLHSERKKCICCDRTFPEEKSCMIHFATCHDKMCILCNHVFESSKRASEHKKNSHCSLDSYFWFMQRVITHITDSLSIDPGLPLVEMISRIFVRCHEVSVSEGDSYKKRIERLRDILSLQTMGRLLATMIDEDDDKDQVILVVTESDYQQYKTNLEELAIRMKQISNALSFGDIKFSLEEYFKSKEQY